MPIWFKPASTSASRTAPRPGTTMAPVRCPWIAASLGACGVLCAAGAAAQDAEPVHLAYDVVAGCPSEGDFLDMVARDGGHVAAASEGQAARSLTLHVERSESMVGRLIVRETDGREATREIHGARCDDVVRSLALLVALSAQPPAPAAETSVPGSTPAAPTPAAPTPGLGVASAAVEPAPGAPEVDLERGIASAPQRWRLGLSGEATLDRGVGTTEVPGLAAYVELIDDTPAFFAPSIRVGVEMPLDQTQSLTFRRIVGRVDGCSWHAVLARPWSDDAFTLHACARLDVGRLQAEAVGSGTTAEVTRPWVAPAGLLRLRWTSVRFFLEIEAGVAFPLVREDFGGGNEVPAVAAIGGLGFGGFFL